MRSQLRAFAVAYGNRPTNWATSLSSIPVEEAMVEQPASDNGLTAAARQSLARGPVVTEGESAIHQSGAQNQRTDADGTKVLSRPGPVLARLDRRERVPAEIDESILIEMARLQSSRYMQMGDILSKPHFLKQVQREKLRSDRSKAPLSIALFTSDGNESDVAALLDLLCNRKRETDILGYLGDGLIGMLLPETNEQGASGLTQKILNQADDLPLSAIARTYPDQLFENLLAENHVLPDLFPFVLPESSSSEEGGHFVKRGLDILGASVALMLASPLMLMIGLAVALTSPGPIIFRQIRLGQRGVPFVFYKFRSMRANADDRIHREYVASLIKGDLEGANQGETGKPLYKLKADPRITKIGRIIRKTSMDELPQLFNVLKGDMSLVGPRPPLPYEVEKYQSWHLRRILEVKPGITGLWQVEGRSKTSFDDMVRLDLRYTRSSSIFLDLKILFKTVKVVLRCDGAK